MKKRVFAGVVILGLAAAAFYFLRPDPGPAPLEGTSHPANRFGDEAPAADADADAGATATATAGGATATAGGAQAQAVPGKPVAPPALTAIREEVHANPHQTPASLMNFAENIANRIEEAEGSPEKARALFEELESCVMDSSQGAMRSIQALCLTNAEDLIGDHPELKERYEQLSRKTPPEVMKLLENAAMLEQ